MEVCKDNDGDFKGKEQIHGESSKAHTPNLRIEEEKQESSIGETNTKTICSVRSEIKSLTDKDKNINLENTQSTLIK